MLSASDVCWIGFLTMIVTIPDWIPVGRMAQYLSRYVYRGKHSEPHNLERESRLACMYSSIVSLLYTHRALCSFCLP